MTPMTEADAGNYRHVRLNHSWFTSYGTLVHHCNFKNRIGRIYGEASHRRKVCISRIEISGGVVSRSTVWKYKCDHVLCSSFTHTSSDTDHLPFKLWACKCCKLAKRMIQAWNFNYRKVTLNIAGRHNSNSPSLDRSFSKSLSSTFRGRYRNINVPRVNVNCGCNYAAYKKLARFVTNNFCPKEFCDPFNGT